MQNIYFLGFFDCENMPPDVESEFQSLMLLIFVDYIEPAVEKRREEGRTCGE